MNSFTIPQPPNAAWMPPIDPNDEVLFHISKGHTLARRSHDRRRIQEHFDPRHEQRFRDFRSS